MAIFVDEVREAPKKKARRSPDGVYRPGREEIRFFMGADAAEAFNKRNDDGAISILRLSPLVEQAGPVLMDWKWEFVHGMRVRRKTAEEWSGIIHGLHRRLGLSGIVLDKGGGGGFIAGSLRSRSQLINGTRLDCPPIVTVEDKTAPPDSEIVLTMFIRSQLQDMWPAETLKGDDNLIDHAHAIFIEAIESGNVQFPVPLDDRSAEERKKCEGWDPERAWAIRIISEGLDQLKHIEAMVDGNGDHVVTRNNARQYRSSKRKDIAYSMLFAYMAARLWLKRLEDDWMGEGEQEDFDVAMGRV
jgi:hypothetical protein